VGLYPLLEGVQQALVHVDKLKPVLDEVVKNFEPVEGPFDSQGTSNWLWPTFLGVVKKIRPDSLKPDDLVPLPDLKEAIGVAHEMYDSLASGLSQGVGTDTDLAVRQTLEPDASALRASKPVWKATREEILDIVPDGYDTGVTVRGPWYAALVEFSDDGVPEKVLEVDERMML
jgi:hypothetical protein